MPDNNNYNAKDIVSLSEKIYGYIYIITNDINNRVYVGKTTTTIEDRFNRHCKNGKFEKNINSIDYAINKYGKEHFNIKEIEKCSIHQLSQREMYWVKYYNSYKKGYNLTLGGEGAQIFSEEQIALGLEMYKNGISLEDIAKQTGMSYNTLYKYLHSNDIPLRERTELQNKASIENLKKATQKNKIKIYNITLDLYYDSKKEALIDMINKGYSKAKDWHNIRTPLDKALKDNTKTFLNFYWRIVNE